MVAGRLYMGMTIVDVEQPPCSPWATLEPKEQFGYRGMRPASNQSRGCCPNWEQRWTWTDQAHRPLRTQLSRRHRRIPALGWRTHEQEGPDTIHVTSPSTDMLRESFASIETEAEEFRELTLTRLPETNAQRLEGRHQVEEESPLEESW